jgi:hypothetical protein
VRDRILAGGEQYWTLSDFRDLSAVAVAHALSRLARDGELQRLRKGLYYRSKTTVFGPSVPSVNAVFAKTARAPLHPAGLSAANFLGLSPQNPMRGEFATSAAAIPGGLSGARVHTRRPLSRATLDSSDGALLELLRDRARFSDLSPQQTVKRLTAMLSDAERFGRLASAALSEPPRVRAMLGALGEQAGMPEKSLQPLRQSLNPLTKFDFGALAALPTARTWQAR